MHNPFVYSSLVIDWASCWRGGEEVEVSRIGHGQLLRGQLCAGYVPPEAGIDHENDVSLFTGDAQVAEGGCRLLGATADLP